MRHATYFNMYGFGKQWLFFVFSIMLIESVSKCISKFETQSIYNKKNHKHVINHLQLVTCYICTISQLTDYMFNIKFNKLLHIFIQSQDKK